MDWFHNIKLGKEFINNKNNLEYLIFLELIKNKQTKKRYIKRNRLYNALNLDAIKTLPNYDINNYILIDYNLDKQIIKEYLLTGKSFYYSD